MQTMPGECDIDWYPASGDLYRIAAAISLRNPEPIGLLR